MKKVKVTIVDKYTLRLEEDAKKGELIDLREIIDVDTTPVIQKIDEARDEVYLSELKKVKAEMSRETELEIRKAVEDKKLEIASLKEQIKQVAESTKAKVASDLNQEIVRLKTQIESIEDQTKLQLQNKHIQEISEKEIEITRLENQLKADIQKLTADNREQVFELTKKYDEEKRALEIEVDNLKRARSSLSVKMIGEDLEAWSDNEYREQNLVGLDNVTWQKDNEVVKGGKADFIYKVYANAEKNEEELLTSVILEMKSEDPTSTSTQDVNRMLDKLNRDRNNKGIEYALLVSELGSDASNALPIKKIFEYEKMYMVRPEYFMMVLNIITAFGLKYKEIMLAKAEERIKFKDYEDILSEFESMKDEILENSVRHINTQLEIIIKQSDNIKLANDRLKDAAELIQRTHLQTVINKIEGFKIGVIATKVKKLDN